MAGYIRSCAFGMVAGFGILLPSVWFLVVIGLSLFLYEVWYRTPSIREACVKALLFGTLYGALALWWLWHVLPMPGIEVSMHIQSVVIGLLWIVCALVCGLSLTLIAAPLYLIRTHTVASIGAAILLVGSEYVRMWLFGILALGPGSLLGAHFSQTSIGYALAESSLLPLSILGGIWILSGTLTLVAAALALVGRWVVERRATSAIHVSIGCVAFVAGLSTYLGTHNSVVLSQPLSVVVIGAHSADGQQGTDILKIIAANETKVDLIVMPEGDRFHTPDAELATIFDERVLIVSSHHPKKEEGYVSEMTFQWSDTGTIATYRKQFLMPQGEYTPYVASALYSFIAELGGPAVERLATPRLVPGNTIASVPLHDTIIAGLICSDLLSPQLYPALARRTGASVLLNLANPAWLKGSGLYDAKIRQIAKVHAVHLRAYLLVSSLDTAAFIASPTGVTNIDDRNAYVIQLLGN